MRRGAGGNSSSSGESRRQSRCNRTEPKGETVGRGRRREMQEGDGSLRRTMGGREMEMGARGVMYLGDRRISKRVGDERHPQPAAGCCLEALLD
jgi:hypothetical protein